MVSAAHGMSWSSCFLMHPHACCAYAYKNFSCMISIINRITVYVYYLLQNLLVHWWFLIEYFKKYEDERTTILLTYIQSWSSFNCIYKITKIVQALWLAERSVCMRVCKHGCDVRCFAFRALITQARIWKSFRVQNSTSLLYLPIPSSAETWKIVTKKVCQFFFA